MKMTLSETITYMIDERESKALYESQMTAMKAGLKTYSINKMKKAKTETWLLIMLNRKIFETF